MAHHEILDVGAASNDDVIDIAAQNGVAPYRGIVAKLNVADDLGRFVEIDSFAQTGRSTKVIGDSHGVISGESEGSVTIDPD
jgi:hypothetical protein